MPVYRTKGTCSAHIDFEVNNGIVTKVNFEKGCNGNGEGISRLVVGMKAAEVVEKLKNTPCGYRGTSCPDQLARALEAHMEKDAKPLGN